MNSDGLRQADRPSPLGQGVDSQIGGFPLEIFRAGPVQKPVCYLLPLPLRPINPIKPLPKRRKLAGSGTGDAI